VTADDPEIQAMMTVSSALGSLADEAARGRVLRWAAERFDIAIGATKKRRDSGGSDGDGARVDEDDSDPDKPTLEHFVDLLGLVDAKTDVERAVAAAYWTQVVEGSTSWQSQQINNMLKDAGVGAKNITVAMTGAQERKPALVRQMAKSGRSRQARKTYKLTTAGVAFIAGRAGLTGASVPDVNGEDDE
jgi:hypothetical protein